MIYFAWGLMGAYFLMYLYISGVNFVDGSFEKF